MMAMKAVTFNDVDSLAKIMMTDNPRKQTDLVKFLWKLERSSNMNTESKIVEHMFEDIDKVIMNRPWYRKLYDKLRFRLQDLYYWYKHFKFQREHGFHPYDSWNFYSRLADHIVPRLKHLMATTAGHPPDMTFEEWQQILGKMIWSFEAIDDYPDPIYSEDYDHRYIQTKTDDGWTSYESMNTTGTVDWTPAEEHKGKIQEGLDLFAKHFQSLWS